MPVIIFKQNNISRKMSFQAKKRLKSNILDILFSDIKNKYDLCYCFIYLIIES